MSAPLTRDEMIRGLMAMGVPREKAIETADAQLTAEGVRRADARALRAAAAEGATTPRRTGGSSAGAPAPAPGAPLPAPTVTVAPNGTLVFVLPWHELAPDNLRVAPIGAEARAKRAQYDAAKAATTARILLQLPEDLARARGTPWSGPVALHARAFVPDDRIRDVSNMVKVVHDALEAARVLRNDRWFWDTRWTRLGVDPVAPRLELVLAAYVAPTLPELACG